MNSQKCQNLDVSSESEELFEDHVEAELRDLKEGLETLHSLLVKLSESLPQWFLALQQSLLQPQEMSKGS